MDIFKGTRFGLFLFARISILICPNFARVYQCVPNKIILINL